MSLTPEEMRMTVEKSALSPLGSSIAAAIVTCVIYFGFFVLAIWNYVVTKYGWYDVTIISTAFRVVAMASRAAYLSHYNPGRQGVFLAFYNAGFSASGAAVWLTLGAWFKHNDITIFSESGDKIARLFCYLMTIPILAFGPILGSLSAGLIYGAWRTAPHAAYLGARCRRATTYGILGIFVILFFWVIILSIRTFSILNINKKAGTSKQNTAPKKKNPPKKPELIWIFIITVAICLVRGCTGVVALYSSKEFVWQDDTWFYCLNVLPDFISLFILCWPKTLARISCSYPPQETEDEERGQGQKNRDAITQSNEA